VNSGINAREETGFAVIFVMQRDY